MVRDDVTTLEASVVPVIPEAGTAAAVMDVLHPKPVFVVQFSASPAAEQDVTLCAIGDADPLVALTRIVFVACVARSASVIKPVAVTAVVNIGLSIDGACDKTTSPKLPVGCMFPRVLSLLYKK